MISNPCKWFISGSNQEEFLYEGGKELWHFSPHDNGLSTTMESNIVFWADSAEHALDVLKRMCEKRIECYKKYETYKNGKQWLDGHEYIEETRASWAKEYLDAIKAGKVKLTKAPTNQMYEVGWASNDTIL